VTPSVAAPGDTTLVTPLQPMLRKCVLLMVFCFLYQTTNMCICRSVAKH